MFTALTPKELAGLEKKYNSPVFVLIVKPDDTKPIYILKEGRAGYDQMCNMQNDIKRLLTTIKKGMEINNG